MRSVPNRTQLLACDPPDEAAHRRAHELFLQSQQTTETFEIEGLTVTATPGVYHPHPKSSSVFTLEHLPFFSGLKALDLGCGTGVIGLHLAARGNAVTLADCDNKAVKAARANAKRNNLKIEIVRSDLFESFERGRTFDRIVFNLKFPISLLRGRRIENKGVQREHCSLWSRAGSIPRPRSQRAAR